MNWQTVRVLFGNELRMLLRDRRTIVIAVALPLLLWPIMFYAIKRTNTDREKNLAAIVYKYAVTGSAADQVRLQIARGAELASRSGSPEATGQDSLAAFRYQEVDVADPAARLKAADIHFYLEGLSGAEADALPAEKSASEGGSAKKQANARGAGFSSPFTCSPSRGPIDPDLFSGRPRCLPGGEFEDARSAAPGPKPGAGCAPPATWSRHPAGSDHAGGKKQCCQRRPGYRVIPGSVFDPLT